MSAYEPYGSSGRSKSRFCSMKPLGIFLLLPRWDASPSQGYPPWGKKFGEKLTVRQIQLGVRRRHCEGEVSMFLSRARIRAATGVLGWIATKLLFIYLFFLTESLQKILTPEDILSNSINHKTKERRSASWNNEHDTAKEEQLVFLKMSSKV